MDFCNTISSVPELTFNKRYFFKNSSSRTYTCWIVINKRKIWKTSGSTSLINKVWSLIRTGSIDVSVDSSPSGAGNLERKIGFVDGELKDIVALVMYLCFLFLIYFTITCYFKHLSLPLVSVGNPKCQIDFTQPSFFLYTLSTGDIDFFYSAQSFVIIWIVLADWDISERSPGKHRSQWRVACCWRCAFPDDNLASTRWPRDCGREGWPEVCHLLRPSSLCRMKFLGSDCAFPYLSWGLRYLPLKSSRKQVFRCKTCMKMKALLAIIALSALQSFPWLLIHNAILFINTSTMHGTTEAIG